MKYAKYTDEQLLNALRNLRTEISYQENKRDYPAMMEAIREFKVAHNEYQARGLE